MRFSFLPVLQYADNTTLNTMSGGDVYGSDDISSVKYSRIKLIHGADGTNDGDVSKTNPYPIRRVPIVDSATAWSVATPGAAVASKVFKASAGILREVNGINTKTSAQYIQVFNSTSAPADATTPVITMLVEAGANYSIDLGEDGQYFSTGITVTNSSTASTKTIGSADCIINGRYL